MLALVCERSAWVIMGRKVRPGAQNAIYDGGEGLVFRARREVLGEAASGRTRWSSARSNNSHWTVSPGFNPRAAASAKGKLM